MIKIEPCELDFELNGYNCVGFYEGGEADAHLFVDYDDGYESACEIVLDSEPEFSNSDVYIMYGIEDGTLVPADNLECIKELEDYFLNYLRDNYELEYVA